MDPVILLEKVRRPAPRGLVRDRLEQRLLAPDGAPVGLVLGPPGSGKTTLLSRVAAGSDVPVAWFRASAEEADESALIRHLAHTLGVTLGEESFPPAVAGSVDTLIAALDAAPDRSAVRLVVDDLHALAGTAAESALERLIWLRPRSVRILLGSRRPPLINTSRLLVDGELVQLDGEDLRFRSWEVEELFRTVYARPLSPETAAALTRRTGGWAAGLQLFHLATSELSRSERERAVAELSGRSRLIRSYLARNVVDGLPVPRRRFLLATSTLGVLTGDLCDGLLGTTGSAAVLDELEREQFFTSSTDGGLTFRYHQVLQTHLEVVLADELGSAAARDLYKRSAALLEAAGRVTAAVRAYARAEDWAAVGRLLHQVGSALPPDEEWLESALHLPGPLADDPGMVVAGARRLLRNGLVEEAVAAYRHAETLMDDPDFTDRCAHERAVASVWLPSPVGLEPKRPFTGRDLHLVTELRLLTRTLRGPAEPSSALARGLHDLLAGDLAVAASGLEQACFEQGDAGPGERLAVRLAARLADLANGPDEASAGRLEEIVLSADLQGLPWLSRMARGLQAALLLALRPSPWRVAACAELIDDAERHGDRWGVCLLSGLVGAAHVLSGRPELAEALLRRSAGAAEQLHAPVLQLWAEALRIALPLEACGDLHVPGSAQLLARSAEALGLERVSELLTARTLPRWFVADHGPVSEEATPDRPESVRSPRFDRIRRSGDPDVALRCLGAFCLEVDGSSMSLGGLRPRARSLLLLLLLHHGHRVHREQLIEAIWPESSPDSGTRSLQVAISSVRQHLIAAGLPGDCLCREGDSYALSLGQVEADLDRFGQLAERASRLARDPSPTRHDLLAAQLSALDAYAGDLLPEVGPAEWVVEERDRLRALAARVAADAGRTALALGEFSSGVRAARRSLELDPYHDTSWDLLVRLFEALGDHSAATVARREHARVCAELGVPDLFGRSAS
jgi:DNA-binding SARP family transcriptional activator